MIELRPYQQECIEAIEEAEKKGTNRPLVALPTGTGKTIVFSTLAKRRGGRTLILAHRDELIEQAVDKMLMVWDSAKIGVVKAERNELDKQIIVGSVQTVSREDRLAQLPTDFDLVITDESHHSPAISYRRVYDYLGLYSEAEGNYGTSDALHLGVTATPNRTDKIGLTPIFQEIVYQKRILDMIPDYLCDLRCVRVLTHINVDGVSTWAGDLRAEQLSELLNTENCNELIVEAWKEHALGRLTLCFTADVAHARDLCSAFRNAGINAAWVSGETPIDERRDILAKFAQREIEVLTNCMVLTEGYDNPAIDCIAIVRPTKSALLYTQMIGRGTRTFPNKRDCLIIDVACISTQHDLVSFPSLFGLPFKQGGEKTLTEQIEEKRSKLKIYGVLRGQGIEREEVDIWRRQESRASDPYSMNNLAWVQVQNGFRLYLGKNGVINIYADFYTPLKYQVFSRNNTENRRLTTHPVELSWAFGLAESEARRVTGGNLVLVDRNARWRQDPATDKQIAKLAELGVYRNFQMTKGEVSDLLSQLFAQNTG